MPPDTKATKPTRVGFDTLVIEPFDEAPTPAIPTGKRLLAVAVGVLAIAAFGAAAAAVIQQRASDTPTAAAADVPTVQTIDQDGWRFSVHLPTGAEAIYDLENDPNCRDNLIRREQDRAAVLRATLLERCGVKTMTELREPHRELTDTLRRLGYL